MAAAMGARCAERIKLAVEDLLGNQTLGPKHLVITQDG